jgi:regulator of replication initiation timing
MHYTYPKTQAAKYEGLIGERRAYLVEHEGLDLAADVSDVDDSALRPGEYDSTRELLDAAGYDLPAANLDSLTEQGEALADDERLDLAFRRASDLDDEDDPEGRTCEACGAALDDLLVCPECPAVEVYGGVPVENHLDESRETFTEGAVEKGVGYVGVVNAVEHYGVFVTIGGDRQDPEDVSGLMPERLVPDRVDLRDYSTGDPVRVVLNHTEDAEDEPGERLFFGWPAEGRVEGHVEQDTAESGVETDSAPEPAHATDGGTQAERGTVSDDPREHTRVEDYDGDLTEYVAALERDTDHMGEVVAEQAERLDTLERENERLRERVDENAEALPSPEQIEELNEAAETVLGADARLDAMSKKVDALAERVEVAERRLDEDLAPIEAFENLDRRVGELESGTNDDEGDLADALETLREYGFEGTFEI